MKFQATANDGQLIFPSPMAERRFAELKNVPLILTVDDRPSSEMRRFFEGGVVPYVFYQHGGWSDFRECREALKLEFLPGWTRSVKGEQVKFARSTSELSKEGFRGFLARIEVWMMEQGMEFPCAEEYTAWKNSAPAKGEVFPPLKRMMENYRQQN